MDARWTITGAGLVFSFMLQVGFFGYFMGRLREATHGQKARMDDYVEHQTALLEAFKDFTESTLKTLAQRMDGGYANLQRLEDENLKAQVGIGALREGLQRHEQNEAIRFDSMDRKIDQVREEVAAIGRRVDGNVAQIQAVVRGELSNLRQAWGK